MTTISTSAILTAFQNNINFDLEYGLAEMKKIFSDSYKAIKAAQTPVKEKKVKLNANGEVKAKKVRKTRERDADGNIVKLRPPSAYNIFVAEKMHLLRATNPGTDNKEIFKMAIVLWNEAKVSIAKKNDNPDAPVEIEAVSEIEEEAEVKIEISNDADDVPTFAPKKPAKKGRKPKVSAPVAEDSE